MLENINGIAITYKPKVSLIIPTLNEAKNLPLVLPYIPLDVVHEVLLVDGRSKDNTIAVAKQLLPSIKVVYETKKGKGAALRCGYEQATGDILVVLDADGSNDPREIPRFIQALLEGADFVKGSRFAPTGGTTDMPRLRKFGNGGFVVLVNTLFSQSFSDLAYGYHAFWRHCLQYLDLKRVDGFEVDAAIYLQAVRKKLRVVEVPSFEGYRFYGEGKLQTFPDGFRVLRTILREWVASLRQPETDLRVGFRSYGQRARQAAFSSVPVTGGTGPAEGDEDIEYAGLHQFLQVHQPERSSIQTHRVMSNVLLNAIEDLGASSGSLLLLDGEENVLGCVRVFGRNIAAVDEEELEDTLLQGFFGWAVQNREPALVKSTFNDPRWLVRPWEREEESSRTALIMPYVVDGRVKAVMTLARPDDRPFSEFDLNRLQNIPVRG